jgi:uncharacterized protein (DUF433 family)
MAKRQIRIRAAIADVRSGMSDTELMDKYQLAAKGLQSLLTKLVASQLITIEELEQRMPEFMQSASLSEDPANSDSEAWKIRRTKPGEGSGQSIRATDAVAAIKAGQSDSQLMEKYRLSSKGLQDLFDKLVKAKLVTRDEVDRRMPTMDQTVDLRGMMSEMNMGELVSAFNEQMDSPWKCPSCGVTKDQAYEVCPECGNGASDVQASPSPRRMKPRQTVKPGGVEPAPTIPTHVPEKRRKAVSISKILADVQAGLTDDELMAKHGIPYEKLDEIFRQLLDSKAITRGELYGRSSLFIDTISVDASSEDATQYLAFPIPVSDAMDSTIVGRLRNVRENLVGMVGIEAKIDEKRSFVVYPEKFVEIQPITFDATCRWFVRESDGYYAGFEITFISDRDRHRLEDLVRSLTLGY